MVAPRFPLTSYLPIENASIKGIEAILKRAARDLERDIIAAAGDNVSSEVKRAQLAAAKASINAHLKQDWRNIAAAITRGQAAAIAAAERVVSEFEWPLFRSLVDRATFEAVVEAEALRAASQVRTLMDRLGGSYIPLSKQVYRTEALVQGWVDNAVNSALARGINAREFAKEIRQFIDPAVPGGASYAAKRLARTEINNAYHVGTLRRYADHGVVQEVDWNLSSSHPEGDECDDYKAQSPWPVESVPTKPHPQCLCFLTPALPDEEAFLSELLIASERASVTDPSMANGVRSGLQRLAEKAKMSYREYQTYALSSSLKPNAGTIMPDIYQSSLARGVFSINAQRATRRALPMPKPNLGYTSSMSWRKPPGGGTTMIAWRRPVPDPPTLPPSQAAITQLRRPALEEIQKAELALEPLKNKPSYIAAKTPAQNINDLKGIKYISFDEVPGKYKPDLVNTKLWTNLSDLEGSSADVTAGLKAEYKQFFSDALAASGMGKKVRLYTPGVNFVMFDQYYDAVNGKVVMTLKSEFEVLGSDGKWDKKYVSFDIDPQAQTFGINFMNKMGSSKTNTDLDLFNALEHLPSTFLGGGTFNHNASGLELADFFKSGWTLAPGNIDSFYEDLVENIKSIMGSKTLSASDREVLEKYQYSGATALKFYMKPEAIASLPISKETMEALFDFYSGYSIKKTFSPAPEAKPKTFVKKKFPNQPSASAPNGSGVTMRDVLLSKPVPPELIPDNELVKNSKKLKSSDLPDGYGSADQYTRYALGRYTAEEYGDMNQYLREVFIRNGKNTVENQIEQMYDQYRNGVESIQNFLYSNRTSNAGYVLRGEDVGGFVRSPDEMEKIFDGSANLVGREVVANQFISTSYVRGFDAPVQIKIYIPEGTFGSQVGNDYEGEFLIPPSSTFQVVGQSVDEAGKYVYLDVVLRSQEKVELPPQLSGSDIIEDALMEEIEEEQEFGV